MADLNEEFNKIDQRLRLLEVRTTPGGSSHSHSYLAQSDVVQGQNVEISYNPDGSIVIGAIGGGSVIVSSTEPTSASEGNLWYNTVSNVLSVYQSGAWVVTGTVNHSALTELDADHHLQYLNVERGDFRYTRVQISTSEPATPEKWTLWVVPGTENPPLTDERWVDIDSSVTWDSVAADLQWQDM